jgi:hypothetical protein
MQGKATALCRADSAAPSYVRNESAEGYASRGENIWSSESPSASLDETNKQLPPTTAREAVRRARAAWARTSSQLSLNVGVDEERLR